MVNAIFFYRIARWFYLHHIPLIPKLITLLIFLIYNSKVSYKCEIGAGTKLGYGGIGVVIQEFVRPTYAGVIFTSDVRHRVVQ